MKSQREYSRKSYYKDLGRTRMLANARQRKRYAAIRANPERLEKERARLAKRGRDRRSNRPEVSMMNNLRSRIARFVSGKSKSGHTSDLLGCSVEELMNYLGSKFQEGMTWDNYGKWHIDHAVPCSSFDLSSPVNQKQCFHYTNLQPLWALDNLKKGTKTYRFYS